MTDLDPLIHAPARLRIMTTLAALPQGNSYAFTKIKDMLEMTAGNLSTHLTKLEDAGYVEISKTFDRKTPVTYVHLTLAGRAAYESYLAALRQLLAST